MTLPPPHKKRPAGRPKENELLRELKVKTWFNAVAEASGKTAYELEKEFSPSYVDRGKFHKQRSRLWEKYRTGKVMPTMKETKGGRRPIALMVEEKYPGTLQWLEHPIWRLLDLNMNITMLDLRIIYQSLPEQIVRLIVNKEAKSVFWRKPCHDPKALIGLLTNQNDIDMIMALGCLWRESMLCQNFALYEAVIASVRSWRKVSQTPPHVKAMVHVLTNHNSSVSSE